MNEPTPKSPESPEPPPPPPPEPTWQRLLVPMLAVLAVVAGLAAIVAYQYLNAGSAPATGEPLHIVPDNGTPSAFKGFAIQPERPAPTFALTDQTGKPWRLEDHRGEVVALFFGYTNCPDVCPQTLQRLADAMPQLGPDSQKFTVALITVDPDRDTPPVLAKYLAGFNPTFVGLTGSPDALQSVAQQYGIQYMKELPPTLATEAAAIAAGHEAAGHEGHVAGTGTPETAGQIAGQASDTAAYTVAHSGVVLLVDPQGQLRSSFLGPFAPDEVVSDVHTLLNNG